MSGEFEATPTLLETGLEMYAACVLLPHLAVGYPLPMAFDPEAFGHILSISVDEDDLTVDEAFELRQRVASRPV